MSNINIINKVFLITPIGKTGSKERTHCERMKKDIFTPLENELNCTFLRADTDNNASIVVSGIFRLLKESDIVIADLIDNNPNVLYEIAIAQSLNKPMIFINPKDNKLPFDISHYTYIEYNTEDFDKKDNEPEVADLKKTIAKKIEKFIQNGTSINDEFYSSFANELLNVSIPNLSEIKTMLSELVAKSNTHHSAENVQVTADFIEGEDNAFKALTAAVNFAHKNVRSTRFSPYTVVGRQNPFFMAIKNKMESGNEYEMHRIISVNHKDKWTEIEKLVTSNIGRNFTIYLTKESYGFEIVIIDDETVFIHFRKNSGNDLGNRGDEIISSTFKFTSTLVAPRFVEIFNNIATNKPIKTIDCSTLTIENVSTQIKQIKSAFDTEFSDLDKYNKQ